MSREAIKLSIKRVFTDRPFLALMAAVIVVGIIYCTIVGFSIQPGDVGAIHTRYIAFGKGHFYKNPWQYLLTFVVFGVVVVVAHLALMVKMHNLERRQTALLIGWAAIAVLIIACNYALSVIRLESRI